MSTKQMKLPKWFISTLLLVLVTLETVAHVQGVKEWDIKCAALTYFFSGILIALLPLIKTTSDLKYLEKNTRRVHIVSTTIFIFSLIGLAYYLFSWSTAIFTKHALDEGSDMLIIIKTMGERFVNGEEVYQILPIWGGTEAIYLPEMWLPYILPNLFGYDIRWTSIIAILLSLCCLFFIGKNEQKTGRNFLILLPLYFLFEGILFTDYRLISLSEEPIVIFYYSFLAFALSKRNPYLIGLAMSLCWMSRFALAFWSAMYLAYLFFFVNKKEAVKTALTTFSICTIMLFVTGAFWQLDIILGLPKIYLEHMLNNEWKFNGFAKTNLGLIGFFPFHSLALTQQIFLIGSIAIPLVSLLLFWKFNNQNPLSTKHSFFAVCTLKLCLVFFYNFLIMPFLYLFYVSTFLSIAILSWYLQGNDELRAVS